MLWVVILVVQTWVHSMYKTSKISGVELGSVRLFKVVGTLQSDYFTVLKADKICYFKMGFIP